MRRSAPVRILGGLALAALVWAPAAARPAAGPSPGPAAPLKEYLHFEIPALDGGKISSKDLLGKIVVLDVWGTWCAPCRQVIPHLMDLQKEFGPKGVVVVGVSAEMGTDRETVTRKVRQFAAEMGINYRLGIIDEILYEEIRRLMRFEKDGFTVPTTVVLDRDGAILARYPGYFFGQEKEIAELVRQRLGREQGRAHSAP